MRYNDGKISELEAVVVANSSDFEKVKVSPKVLTVVLILNLHSPYNLH